MTDRFEVIHYGTDSSGRDIWMTRYMAAWLHAVKTDWRVKPFADKLTIVQGAFMLRDGGGAQASAGYHDKGGCIDFRTWNLTSDELDTFIFTARCYGGAAWRRDADHGGMDPHCHVTLGGDQPMSDGARNSWISYMNGRNGLTGASEGADYERRPKPLVTSFTGPLAEDNELTPDDRDFIKNQFDLLQKRLNAFRTGSADRDKKILDALEALEEQVQGKAAKEQVRKTRLALQDDLDELQKSFESSH